MTFFIRIHGPTGKLGEHTETDEKVARETFKSLKPYALEKGARLELWKDTELLDAVGEETKP